MHNGSEKGAALVEMALVTPFLVLVLFGIIEFGYLFGQYNEVRHGVHEGARYAAVSGPDINGGGVDSSDVFDVVCDAMNLTAGTTVAIDIAQVTGGETGDTAEISVTADVSSLTGAPLITLFLPDELEKTASFRLEQPAAWGDDSGTC